MIAKRLHHKRIGAKLLDGVFKRIGKTLDIVEAAAGGVHFENVFVDFTRRRHALFNAVEAGRQAERKRQVGVAGRIGAAELETGALAAGGGDTDQRAPVGRGPGQVAGAS